MTSEQRIRALAHLMQVLSALSLMSMEIRGDHTLDAQCGALMKAAGELGEVINLAEVRA